MMSKNIRGESNWKAYFAKKFSNVRKMLKKQLCEKELVKKKMKIDKPIRAWY